MKRILTLFLAVVFTAMLFPATAMAETDTKTEGDFTFEAVGDGTSRLVKYNGTGVRQVIVPETLGDMPVSEIGAEAFRDNGDLTKITLPNSITWILSYAFYNCFNLEEINLPTQLHKIDTGAFEKCYRLYNLTFPATLKIIEGSAFANCDAFTNVNLPNGMTELGSYAFSDCNSLEEVYIPGTVKSVNEGTFRYCNSLKTVILNDGTTALNGGDWYDWEATFLGCNNLTKLVVPASVRAIGYYSGSAQRESLFHDTDTSNLTIYCTENSAIHKLALAWGIKVSVPISPPAKTTGLKGTPGEEDVKLTWISVDGAAGYGIWRSTDNVNYEVVSTSDSTSYTCKGLNKNTTYYFKVRAYKFNGSEQVYGEFSDPISVTTGATATPNTPPATTTPGTTKPGSTTPGTTTPSAVKIAAPAGIKAVASGADKIKVSWNAVGGAKGYELQVSTNGRSFKSLKLTSGKSFTHTKLTPGTKYYYRVRAYKMSGGSRVYGTYSKVVSVTLKLSSPKSARAAAIAGGSAKITWGGVAGASGYVVERSTSKTSGFKPVKTATAKTFTDKKLKKGATYYYRVRAYRNSGGKKVYGAYSAVFSVKAK